MLLPPTPLLAPELFTRIGLLSFYLGYFLLAIFVLQLYFE